MMWQAINTLGLLGLAIMAFVNRRTLKNVSIAIDGRLTQLLELTARSSHAEGVEQQRVTDDHK